MENLLISFFLLTSLGINAQRIVLKQSNIDSFPCPSDPATNNYTYKDWKIYQTVDDTWQGMVDDSTCPTLQEERAGSGRYGIDLSILFNDLTISRKISKLLLTYRKNRGQ